MQPKPAGPPSGWEVLEGSCPPCPPPSPDLGPTQDLSPFKIAESISNNKEQADAPSSETVGQCCRKERQPGVSCIPGEAREALGLRGTPERLSMGLESPVESSML